jgi:hypothetical protein
MKTLIREVVAMVSTRKLMTYELCVVSLSFDLSLTIVER